MGRPARTARSTLDRFYAIPTRDPSARQLTTGHCPAVPTRASQSDSRRRRRAGRPTPAPPTTTTRSANTPQHQPELDSGVHLRSGLYDEDTAVGYGGLGPPGRGRLRRVAVTGCGPSRLARGDTCREAIRWRRFT